MQDLRKLIDERTPRWLEELFGLLCIPSISSTEEGIEGVPACAELLVREMRRLGIETTVHPTGDGPDILTGELRCPRADAPTVLIYGHYDVQPAGDRSLWRTDPFTPTVQDGRIYCRGVADDKGQFYAHLKAIEAYKAVRGELPVHLKFLFEGEEEVGSRHLRDFVAAHRELLACDVALNSDAAMHESGRPTLVLGLKGSYTPILEVRTANRDVHSMHGATVPSAAWRMIGLLSTLKGEDGKVLIDGFYDDVREPTELELETLGTIPDAEAQIKAELGVEHFVRGRVTDNFNYNTVFEPTCNINSLRSGHLGAGNNNIVPATARVRLDMRLVPNQTPERIHELFKAHLHKHGYDDVEFLAQGGGAPLRVPADDPYAKAAAEVLGEVWGEPGVIWPNIGGSGPFALFTELLGAPFLLIPYAAADQCEHAPNENMKIDDFKRGVLASIRLYERFGNL